MANKFYISVFLSLFFLIEACDVMDKNKLKVYNNSQDTIFCLWTTENNFRAYTYSPLEQSKAYNGKDTVLAKSNNILFPNDSSFFSNYDWPKEINSSKLKKLNLFIFRYSALQKKSWDDIKKDTLYDRKISLTIDELNAKGWEIRYK